MFLRLILKTFFQCTLIFVDEIQFSDFCNLRNETIGLKVEV